MDDNRLRPEGRRRINRSRHILRQAERLVEEAILQQEGHQEVILQQEHQEVITSDKIIVMLIYFGGVANAAQYSSGYPPAGGAPGGGYPPAGGAPGGKKIGKLAFLCMSLCRKPFGSTIVLDRTLLSDVIIMSLGNASQYNSGYPPAGGPGGYPPAGGG